MNLYASPRAPARPASKFPCFLLLFIFSHFVAFASNVVFMGECENLTHGGKANLVLQIDKQDKDRFEGQLRITGELTGSGKVTGTRTDDSLAFKLVANTYSIRFRSTLHAPGAFRGDYEVLENGPNALDTRQVGRWSVELVTDGSYDRLRDQSEKRAAAFTGKITEGSVKKELETVLNQTVMDEVTGARVFVPQSLFEQFHPTGQAKSVEVQSVQIVWRDPDKRHTAEDVATIKLTLKLNWDGPVTKGGYTLIDTAITNGEFESMTLAKTNGVTWEKAREVTFKASAALTALLLSSLAGE
jgi:hypothetical protein